MLALGYYGVEAYDISMPFGSAPSSEALQSAIATLDAKAAFNGSEQEVHVRVAPSPDGSIYIDLGNAEWNAIEITLDGWEVVGNPSVCQVHQAQGAYIYWSVRSEADRSNPGDPWESIFPRRRTTILITTRMQP